MTEATTTLTRAAIAVAVALCGCSARPLAPSTASAAATLPASRQAWAGQVRAAVRKNIRLREDVPGNPVSEVDLWLGPQGYILNARLVKSSGVDAWDKAVMDALTRTDRLPLDAEGGIPSKVRLVFRRRDV